MDCLRMMPPSSKGGYLILQNSAVIVKFLTVKSQAAGVFFVNITFFRIFLLFFSFATKAM